MTHTTQRDIEIESDSMVVTNDEIISWYAGLKERSQDTWLQAVTGRNTAHGLGFSITTDDKDGRTMEIEYEYLTERTE